MALLASIVSRSAKTETAGLSGSDQARANVSARPASRPCTATRRVSGSCFTASAKRCAILPGPTTAQPNSRIAVRPVNQARAGQLSRQNGPRPLAAAIWASLRAGDSSTMDQSKRQAQFPSVRARQVHAVVAVESQHVLHLVHRHVRDRIAGRLDQAPMEILRVRSPGRPRRNGARALGALSHQPRAVSLSWVPV